MQGCGWVATVEAMRGWLGAALPAKLRTLREFAEQEVRIPDGPFEGSLYRCERQPVTKHFFDAVDSGRYSRVFATGPTQSGKTLTCFIIPCLYHLFEWGETVICGVPNMDMAADKWRRDLLPAIQHTRYADLLPTEGAGSKGAMRTSITFKNGAVLRFMPGGGSDKTRAGYTSRVVVLTEVDGMDEAGATSREADKISQFEARTFAWGDLARIYGECTVSIEQGRTWQEYTTGTQSAVLCPCPHCGEHVLPERNHLVGWEDAENEIAAMAGATLCCPTCGAVWTEEERRVAVAQSVLVHRGQRVERGQAVGDHPETRTLGFRWNATHNLLVTVREYASRLWTQTCRDNVDEELAERFACQFVWATPYIPPTVELAPLEPSVVNARRTELRDGILPADTTHVAVGVDVGKYKLHWTVIAWRGDKGHVAEYSEHPVYADRVDPDLALLIALRELRDFFEDGWVVHGSERRIAPQQVWIDSGWNSPVIYRFCRESGRRYRPIKGHGTVTKPGYVSGYTAPTKQSATVRLIGEEFHVSYLKSEGLELVHVNADYWKSWLQRRLNTPVDAAGSVTLYANPVKTWHVKFAKSLCAEGAEEKFEPGKGTVQVWRVKPGMRNRSHYLDATYLSCAALSLCGATIHDKTAGGELRNLAKRGPKRPVVTTYRR